MARGGRALVASLWLAAAPLAQAGGPWIVGPEGAPMSLADAVSAASDGDVIEILAGDYRTPLLIENRRLTFRGIGKVVVHGDGKVGASHALFTVRGGAVTLENLEFRGARSQDGGGAGVRMDGGVLTLRQVQLYDNEHGVLASGNADTELVIERCVFGSAPRVDGGLYHLLNVGRIGKLTVTGSRFQQGYEGHLIKSRARETTLAYNFIHDGVRGGASYEVEIANGGVATLIGNVIGQGADSQNRVVVAYGSEGGGWPKNELRLAHNTMITYTWTPAWFLRVFKDRLPPDVQVWAVNNLTVGPGVFWLGAPGHFDGNRPATRGMLRDIWTYGFELPAGSRWRGSGVDPSNVGGQDLTPKGEFEWPADVRPLKPGATSWSPGAFQR